MSTWEPDPVRKALYGAMASDGGTVGCLTYHEGQPDGLLASAVGVTHAIYHDNAPEGAEYPFIVFNRADDRPTNATAFGSPWKIYTLYETDVWHVKAVDHNTSANRADQIAARLKTLLNGHPLSISGGTCLAFHRDSGIEYSEIIDGERFIHRGGVFRLNRV